ncbi:hypothetical protein CFC21_068627 [Triticum aestivum]|uniref:Zinc-finger domain-containing protein n=2 Tax=Triticum aestivum TaxID=4565 RepID=A0A3B6KSQ2_WHEAT|nr:hypothetical protein CFC21_068627 [Triticum aestivum]
MDIMVPCPLEWNGVGGMENVSRDRDDAHGEENNYTYSMERVTTKTSKGSYSMESNGVLLQIEKTCHQCRQKMAINLMAACKNMKKSRLCSLKYCRNCLHNRYGENYIRVGLQDAWSCPKCRGECNCSVCMTNNGEKPTGNLTRAAKASGCSSVHEFLNKGSYVVAAPQNLVTPLKSADAAKFRASAGALNLLGHTKHIFNRLPDLNLPLGPSEVGFQALQAHINADLNVKKEQDILNIDLNMTVQNLFVNYAPNADESELVDESIEIVNEGERKIQSLALAPIQENKVLSLNDPIQPDKLDTQPNITNGPSKNVVVGTREDSSNPMLEMAPLGFCIKDIHVVGSEGILISEACFAPGVDSSKVVQAPTPKMQLPNVEKDDVDITFSTHQNKPTTLLTPGETAEQISTTSEMRVKGKRKKRAPLVDLIASEVKPKEKNEDILNKKPNRRVGKVATMKGEPLLHNEPKSVEL